MLGEPRARTVSVGRRALSHALASRAVLDGAPDDEPATVVEAWAYDPLLLTESDIVDPLSLRLSLRDETDERARAALDALVETVRC
ncbi:MAG: hypothetical protein HMLKMBBP_01414 [Planctomycetes bacterium]|nr:hypothetical protein [Planctomycetota bacterium]